MFLLYSDVSSLHRPTYALMYLQLLHTMIIILLPTINNNNNKNIYIAPWFQVTMFKGAVTNKKIKIKVKI